MIYDKMKIISEDNSKVKQKLKKIANKNFVKIVCNDNKTTERQLLEIFVKENKCYVEDIQIEENDIFKKYHFVANIFCDVNNNYSKDYSKFVRKRKNKSELLLKKYEYSKNFDSTIGAIYLSDEDFYAIRNSKLKEFIFSKSGESFNFVIPNETGFLLRGAVTYYYLLSSKGKFEHVTIDRFKELYDNYSNYFKNISEVLRPNDDKVLVMSVLDNIRNYILQIINFYTIMHQKGDETILVEFANKDILDIIYDVYEQMINILEINRFEYKRIINILDRVLELNYLDDIKKVSEKLYDKMLKSHRECDNFLENYVCIRDYYQNNKKEKYYLSSLYGGIEIPLIFYYLTSKKSYVYYISLFGIYKERHKSRFNYNDKRFIINKNIYHKTKHFVLCDDNMMTGKTVQYIIDSLALSNVKVKNIFLINYVALNRIFQVIDNLTLMDLKLIDKYIFGMYYPTKYSKIKFNKNINGTYMDEFNLFDLSKEYICYFLFKNGLYTKESRINNYRIEGL